jgi:hypothetical protein
MQTVINLIPLLGGGYFIILSLILTTRNLKSAFIFRIIPMFLGLGCLFSGGKLFGWF